MAGYRNDSSQMKEVLQPDSDRPEHCHKEKEMHAREDDRTDSSGQASSPSTSSSSAPPSTKAASHRQTEADKTQCTQMKDSVSSCCLLVDLKRLPQCTNVLGPLKFGKAYTVLINVDIFNEKEELHPQQGRDVWMSNVVKMPCSPASFATAKTGRLKPFTSVSRWDMISKSLNKLAKKTTADVHDVEQTIMKYNPKYNGQWSFDALADFVKCDRTAENYSRMLFPKIAALALKLTDYVKKTIPLLQSGHCAAITLSQVQISCLLANAFFCTFPHRNTTASNAEYGRYPTINFTSLFGNSSDRKKKKLRAIMHYFKVVTDDKADLNGLLTFERRCLRNTDIPNWRRCTETMPKLYVSSHGTIETEGTGMLQVDFASSWIGGGVLGSGLVQEEILFLMNPELIVARLFTEKLQDNECLVITGSQQFSCYAGFGDTFEWNGSYEDRVGRDKWARKQRQILAIDALNFKHRRDQYSMRMVARELNKAYCGFKGQGSDEPDIATGKWGCGAFNGDPQLKAVIQLMAAARAKRGLAFFTFQDEELKQGLQQIHQLLIKDRTTVGTLYEHLENFCAIQQASNSSHVDLFQFLRNTRTDSRSHL